MSYSQPRPQQTPYPRILIGGYSKTALRRVARTGDGWAIQKITSRPEITEGIAFIQEQPEFIANPRLLDVAAPLWKARSTLGTHDVLASARPIYERDAILEQVAALAALGVTTTAAEEALPPAPDHYTAADAVTHMVEQLHTVRGRHLAEVRRIAAAVRPVGALARSADSSLCLRPLP